MTLDIPNAFVQTSVPQGKGEDKIIMKIRGVLIDIFLEMIPETYGEHVVYEGKHKFIYV